MKNRLIIFILLLLTPTIINASSITVTCDSETIKNDSFSCDIKGNSNSIVIGLSMKVKTGSGISFSSFTRNNKWQGDGEGGKIDLYTSEDIKGNFDIGKITFNVNKSLNGTDSSIGLNEITFFSEDGSSEKINSYNKTIRIASTNNNLSSLSINNGILNPSFNSNITTYSTTIDSSSVIISAQAEHNRANVSGDTGKKNLSYGNNTFRINVTSESGNKKTYTINIIRPNSTSTNNKETNNTEEKKDNNNYLKEIKSNDFKIDFNKEKLEYDIEVPNDKEKVDIEAIPEKEKSKVKISNIDKLEVGKNKIEITVTSENNNTRTYILNITRLEKEDTEESNESLDGDISNIIIKNYDIYFNKNTLEYDLKIKYEKKLDIKVILSNNNTKYTIEGNNKLKNNSIIKIKVNNQNKEYKIHIKKNDKVVKTIFIVIYIILIIINVIRIMLKRRKSNYE